MRDLTPTRSRWTRALKARARALHDDTDAVAMTEYIIVFSLITIGSAVALIGVAAYVKGYRDFLIWWLAHPAT